MYSSILVPHAGSSAGDKALAHAAKLAKDNHAKVTVLHVVESASVPLSLAYLERKKIAETVARVEDELKKDMYEYLDAKVTELRKQGVEANVVVAQGYPDEEIARMIDAEKYDLIVMAKRRKLPGIRSVLKLGSVSRKILERVSCPLLLLDGGEGQ